MRLNLADDGIGFRLPAAFASLVQQGNLGLMGIQERVWAAHGELVITSTPGGWAGMQVTIPVAPLPAAPA